MQHVKVPLHIMQEIMNTLGRLPYGSVRGLMPALESLKVEATVDAPAVPQEEPKPDAAATPEEPRYDPASGNWD